MKIHQLTEHIEDPELALQMLKDGNARYLQGLIDKTDIIKNRELLEKANDPFAIILTCSDSRVPPEILFDLKQGDIFVIRNAGNIVDRIVLANIEYAIRWFKSKLVVVCGHTNCGAVNSAYSGGEYPKNIQRIVDIIKPAVEKGCDLDKVIHNNVELMVKKIKEDEEIKKLEGIKIVGAFYDVHTGMVEWL